MEKKTNRAKVQMKQIAEKLGLSPVTVSIVLNGRGDQMRIAQNTQQRIQDMAREMDYQPNIYARRLRKSGEEEAPLIIALFWREEYLDDLLARFLKGLYQAIKKQSQKIELVLQSYDFGNLEHYHRYINSNHYNGAIIGGISKEDQLYLEQNDFDIPLVLVGRNTQKYHSVMINYHEAGMTCAHLFSLRKHKTAGLIGLSTKGEAVRLIEHAFLETCKEKGIYLEKELISYCKDRSFSSGYESAMGLLSQEHRPTALFVMDVRNALGVLKACKTMSLRMPEDIEILVFGENEIFSYSEPTITCILQPMEQFAESALNMLLISIKGKADHPMTEELAPLFHIRESCGGFPN